MSGYLLASDFDGTLIHWPSPELSDYDKEAIRNFRKAGNKFVVITGRSYGGSLGGLKAVDFDDLDAVLCLNGAYCMKPDGTEIYDLRGKNTHGIDYFNFFIETGANYLSLDIGQKTYCVDIGDGKFRDASEVMPLETALKLENFSAFTTGYNSVEIAYEMSKELKKKFGDMITPLQNHSSIDMPRAGLSKATGAKNVADLFGISEDKIYTVGDGYNDLNMIAEFHGSAMANAPDEVKSSAERTVEYVGDVAKIIMGE